MSESAVQRLAALEVKCPQCVDGNIAVALRGGSYEKRCFTCRGTNQAPRFPMLRRWDHTVSGWVWFTIERDVLEKLLEALHQEQPEASVELSSRNAMHYVAVRWVWAQEAERVISALSRDETDSYAEALALTLGKILHAKEQI